MMLVYYYSYYNHKHYTMNKMIPCDKWNTIISGSVKKVIHYNWSWVYNVQQRQVSDMIPSGKFKSIFSVSVHLF